jgi:hypothetical protein
MTRPEVRGPSRRWVVAAAAWVIFVALVLAGVLLFTCPWHHQPRWTRSFRGVSELPLERVERVEIDHVRSQLRVVESYLDGRPQMGYLRFRLEWPGAVSSLHLRVRPLSLFDKTRLVVYPVPAYLPHESVDKTINVREVRGQVSAWANGIWNVEFHLPTPASQLELALPVQAELELVQTDVQYTFEDPWVGMLNHVPSLVKWSYVGLVIWWLVRWGPAAWPFHRLPRPRMNHRTARYLLLGFVAVQGIVLILFLPPFQGPDENVHWKAALGLYRTGATREPAAYLLPDLLAAEYPRWYCFIPFQGQLFRVDARNLDEEVKPIVVDYSNPCTYPLVGLLASWYPRIETTAEAVCFFYLCRLLPWLLGIILLAWMNYRGWLSYSLLVFISFPLVTQQLVVVSSDTITNWGTLAAGCVFVSAWRRPAPIKAISLTLLAVVVVLAKPPIYFGMVVLPLLLVPWAKLPYKRIWLPLGGLALLLGVMFAVRMGWAILEKSPESGQSARMAAQLAYVLTPEGLERFLWSCRWLIFRDERFLDDWFQPLGWLDTQLSEWHRLLIWSAFWFALVVDLIERRLELYTTWRQQRWLWLAWLAMALGYFLSQMFAICGLMYIVHTPLKQYGLTGVQVRYLFPGVLLSFILPFATSIRIVRPSWQVSSWLAWPSLIFLGGGLVYRTIALALDLIVRYWH